MRRAIGFIAVLTIGLAAVLNARIIKTTVVDASGTAEIGVSTTNLVFNGGFDSTLTNAVTNGTFTNPSTSIITNGNFSAATKWTLGTGWTITGGKAVADSVTTDLTYAKALYGYADQPFRVVYTISSYTAGRVRVEAGATATGDWLAQDSAAITQDFPKGGRNLVFNADTSSGVGFAGSIDDVAVYLLRGTSWYWTESDSGWTISGNVASHTGAGLLDAMYQPSVLTVGHKYRIVYTVSAYTSGRVRFVMGDSVGTWRTSASTFTEYQEAASTSFTFQADTSSATGFVGSLDNLYVYDVDSNQGWYWGEDFTHTDSTAVADSACTDSLMQVGILKNGEYYRISYFLQNRETGYLTVKFGGATIASTDSNGSITHNGRATGTDLIFLPDTTFDGEIDSVRVYIHDGYWNEIQNTGADTLTFSAVLRPGQGAETLSTIKLPWGTSLRANFSSIAVTEGSGIATRDDQ